MIHKNILLSDLETLPVMSQLVAYMMYDCYVVVFMLKEGMSDFIEVYDNALSKDFCQKLIRYFNNSPKRKSGVTGHGIDPRKKQSEDLAISLQPEWFHLDSLIKQETYQYLIAYMRRYSHLLTGVLSPAVVDSETGETIPLNTEYIAQLSDQAVTKILTRFYYIGTINAQKYKQKQDGYYHYHSEIYPSPQIKNYETLHRVLLFMYYLNDVTQGGETEFFYQNRLISPQAGKLVIAPAGFTHTHKGHIPISNDKYILTSWVLFKPAEAIYSQY